MKVGLENTLSKNCFNRIRFGRYVFVTDINVFIMSFQFLVTGLLGFLCAKKKTAYMVSIKHCGTVGILLDSSFVNWCLKSTCRIPNSGCVCSYHISSLLLIIIHNSPDCLVGHFKEVLSN